MKRYWCALMLVFLAGCGGGGGSGSATNQPTTVPSTADVATGGSANPWGTEFNVTKAETNLFGAAVLSDGSTLTVQGGPSGDVQLVLFSPRGEELQRFPFKSPVAWDNGAVTYYPMGYLVIKPDASGGAFLAWTQPEAHPATSEPIREFYLARYKAGLGVVKENQLKSGAAGTVDSFSVALSGNGSLVAAWLEGDASVNMYGNRRVFTSSYDDTKGWATPISLSEEYDSFASLNGVIKVDADNALGCLIVWSVEEPSRWGSLLYAAISKDGGQSFSKTLLHDGAALQTHVILHGVGLLDDGRAMIFTQEQGQRVSPDSAPPVAIGYHLFTSGQWAPFNQVADYQGENVVKVSIQHNGQGVLLLSDASYIGVARFNVDRLLEYKQFDADITTTDGFEYVDVALSASGAVSVIYSQLDHLVTLNNYLLRGIQFGPQSGWGVPRTLSDKDVPVLYQGLLSSAYSGSAYLARRSGDGNSVRDSWVSLFEFAH